MHAGVHQGPLRDDRRVRRGIGLITATLASGMAFTAVGPVHVSAASISVTTTADVLDAAATCPTVTIASLPGPDGRTSLREAVCAANANPGADTITFSVNGTFVLTGAPSEDNGTTGDLDVTGSTQINGNGIANTIIDGGGIDRILDVDTLSPITFGLSALTVQHGDTRSASYQGAGAIFLQGTVTSTITGVRIRDNFSGSAGALENRGTLTLSNSVVSGNQTMPISGSVQGGGMFNSGPLTITDSTFTGNTVQGEGGAIATTTPTSVPVTISRTTFSGNVASSTGGGLGSGGAISTTGNKGPIALTNVTFSGNQADTDGGALYLVSDPITRTASAALEGVTITANIADKDDNGSGGAGGLTRAFGTVTLSDSIVAGNLNSTPAVRDDIRGSVQSSSSNNIVGDGTGTSGITNGTNGNQVGSGASPIDPKLGPLADNGGPTQTHALLAGSPAINAGNTAACASTDQRGVARAGTCDVGAFELSDTTPPDTTIATTPPSPSASATATFTFSGTDAGGSGLAGFECRIDAGAFSACTSAFATPALADGLHTFSVRARDAVGNVDPTPATFGWTIDTTAPDTTITTGPTNPSASSTASFAFSGIDGGTGLAGFQCRIDGASFTACATPQSYAGLTDGAHTVEVRAVDGVGNTDPTPAAFTWVIDTTAPDTSLTGGPADPSASGDASFSFNGADAGSGLAGFQCRLDGAAYAACTSPQAFTGLTDGPHTFDVRAVDATGNVDPTPATRSWTIDTGAPGTSITAHPVDPSATADASFSFGGDDGTGSGVASFECRLDAGVFGTCTSPQPYVGLTDGAHTFEVRSVDGAGTVDPTPATFTWVVDTTAPDTAITHPPTDPSGSTDQSFPFAGDDGTGSGVVGFECRLDSAAFAPCTSPQLLVGLTDGTHTFAVRAIDAAGNVDATPASTTWVVDATGPDTTVTGGPPSSTTETTATFTFGGTDDGGSGVVGFECRLDGAAFAPCTSPATYRNLSVGAHAFQVRTVDTVGNVDATPSSITWTVVEQASAAPEPTAPPTTTATTVATTVATPATTAATPATTVAPAVLPTVLPTLPSAGGRLPETGANSTQEWLTLGMVLLAAGALLLVARRRGRLA